MESKSNFHIWENAFVRHWTSVILNGSLGGDFLMDYTAMRCQGHWKMVRYLFAYYVAVIIVHFSSIEFYWIKEIAIGFNRCAFKFNRILLD